MSEDRMLCTSRTLPFSPSDIYAAFASADLLALWWGPQGFTNTFDFFDFTVGGRWKFVMHGPDGRDYPNECIFSELVPDTRVVIEHVCAPHFVLTISLEPVTDGTSLVWEQVFDNSETALAVEPVAGPGNEQNIDRLTHVLERQAASL